MSTVQDPGSPQFPQRKDSDQLPASPIATQRPSQGSLLSDIQSKHSSWLQDIPLVGFIYGLFANSDIKKEYIQAIRKQFIDGAGPDTWNMAIATRKFDANFLPFLSNCSLEELPFYESLLTSADGIQFCMQHALPPRPLLDAAFKTLPRVQRLIGRLLPEQQRTYLQAWILSSEELKLDDFKPFLDRFTAHIGYAENLQSQRPKTFDQDSKERNYLLNDSMDIMEKWRQQYDRIKLFDMALRDTTVVDNRQILQYSVETIYSSITPGQILRAVPNLEERTTTGKIDAPYGLLNQVGVSTTLPKGDDNQLIHNFHPAVEAYLTDPYTMETRCVRLALPIKETITIGEARKQLQLLRNFIGTSHGFDEQYQKSELPAEQKAGLLQQFKVFDRKLGVEFGRALGDFNSTPTRPRETSARKLPANAAAINAPRSQARAIESAKLRNLFLLQDGTLSLIPSEPGENHRNIGTLSREEVAGAVSALKKKSDKAVLYIPDPANPQAIKPATLSFKASVQELVETPYLIVEATITVDGKTTSHTTYYACKPHPQTKIRESAEEVMDRITTSRLFERDLLIAKAKFIEDHVKTGRPVS